MAAPTQILPDWLSYSATIITGAGGLPLTTSTAVIYLPLTYYGPSIPLDPDWTYGGLTPPASTDSSPSASALTSDTTTIVESITKTPILSATLTSPFAIPFTTLTSSLTSYTYIPIPSATPSFSPTPSEIHSTFTPTSLTRPLSTIVTSTPVLSLTSSLFSSNLPSTSSSTTSFTPISAPASSSVAKTDRIGIILGTILGSVLFLLICLIIKMLIQRRSQRSDTRFTMLTPIDDDYFLVGIQGRSAGEGSPRGSGEEADPFLRRRGGSPTTPTMRQTGPQTATLSRSAASNVKRVPVPAPSLSSNNTSNTTSTNSGYGVLLEHPTLGTVHRTNEERRGNILTFGELQRVDEELGSVQQTSPGDHPSLLPPPRLVVPPQGLSAYISQRSLGSHRSSYPVDADEAATLLTARRVKAEDLSSRSPPQLHKDEQPNTRPSSGWMSGLGLGALTGLNWFKNVDSTPRRNSRPITRPESLLIAKELSDTDIETGRTLLGAEMPTSYRQFGVVLGPEGERISGDSAGSGASGNTIYHDANSTTPSLTPLPRALAPASQPGNNSGWPTSDVEEPPLDFAHSGTAIPSHNPLPGVDVLDMPAPPSMSTFASSSTLRDTDSSTSGVRKVPFPPGLGLGALPTPQVWREGLDGETRSPGSFPAGDNRAVIGARILFDVLEDEPPRAGEGWKSLAGVVSSGLSEGGRRTTFGLPQFVHPHDPTVSERGSLHSMRSHMSPSSSRSAGSSPASRRLLSGSAGSGSSRPSAHSAAHSGSFASGGSISSDGRKRTRTPGPMSPALSAFGRSGGPAVNETAGSPTSAQFQLERSNVGVSMTTATLDTSSGTIAMDLTKPTTPGLYFPNLPWAGGLEHDWTPK